MNWAIPWKKSTEKIAEKQDTPFLKRKLTGKIEKTKLKIKKCEKFEVEKEEFKPLEVINKLELVEENKGQCEIMWGQLRNHSHRVENFVSEVTSSSKTWNSKWAFQNSDAITRVQLKWQTNRANS